MAWAAVAGAGVGLLSSMNQPKSQTQTNTKEPWAPAQGSMIDNLQQGRNLQDFYQANPFSNAQKTAYGNQFALSDAYRQQLPQLAAGMNRGQFNRANPAARPTQTNFSMPQNLGMGSMVQSQPFAANQMPSTAPIARYQAPPAASDNSQKKSFWDPLGIGSGVGDANKFFLTGGLSGLGF